MTVTESSYHDGRPKGLRIGDAEKTEAISQLERHFRLGRITKEELDERVSKCLMATLDSELNKLISGFAPVPVEDTADKQEIRRLQGRLTASRRLISYYQIIIFIFGVLGILAVFQDITHALF